MSRLEGLAKIVAETALAAARAKDDVSDVAKRMKKSNDLLDELTSEVMKRNPGMSWGKARVQATLSEDYSDRVREEKLMQHGPGY